MTSGLATQGGLHWTPGFGARVLRLLRIILLVPFAGEAQTPPHSIEYPLKLEDAFGLVRFQVITGEAAALSPDGESIAYTACDTKRIRLDSGVADQNAAGARAATNRMGCDVWVSKAETLRARNLTRGAGNSWGPSWSPDGRFLAFYSDREHGPRLWLWDRRRDSIHDVSPVPVRTTNDWEVPAWAPNSRHILVKLQPNGVTDPGAQEGRVLRGRPMAHAEGTRDSALTIHISGQSDQGGKTILTEDSTAQPSDNPALSDLAIIDIASGRARVIAPRILSNRYLFSPDGSHVGYVITTRRVKESDHNAVTYTHVCDLVVHDITTVSSRVVAREVLQWWGSSLSWSPDGKWLAYIHGAAGFPNQQTYAERGNLHIVQASGGSPREFKGAPSNIFDSESFGPLWDPEGKHLYLIGDGRLWRATASTGLVSSVTPPMKTRPEVIVQSSGGGRIWSPDGGASVYLIATDSLRKRSGIYKIHLGTGDIGRLYDAAQRDEFRYRPPVGSADGRRVIFRAESAIASEDLWVADAPFRKVRRLTLLNPQLARHKFGASRLLTFRSADGKPLQAALFLPANYVDGTRYPLIVWVYAGALGSDWLNAFGMLSAPFNMHVLTTRGYAVLWPDTPVQLGTPVEDLVKATVPAVDRVVQLGIADPERLAVMGHSNGGYSVLALLTRTSQFKAAVMTAGFGNLPAMYGSMAPDGTARFISWYESLTGAMGGPPWQVPMRYVENSPIFHLDRVQTPLLMQVGTADPALTHVSDEVFVGLRRLGRKVVYLRYSGEGHELRHVPNQIDFWNRVIAFLGVELRTAQSSSVDSQAPH